MLGGYAQVCARAIGRFGVLDVWYLRPVTYLYLALLQSRMQQCFQDDIVQISTNVVQDVVQYFCIPEQKHPLGEAELLSQSQ